MAQIAHPKPPATSAYTVLRALCMAGQRVEVGETVELTPSQYAEASNAGKVGPLQPKPTKPTKTQPRAKELTASTEAQPIEAPNE